MQMDIMQDLNNPSGISLGHKKIQGLPHGQQKRQHSCSYEMRGSNSAKRRIGTGANARRSVSNLDCTSSRQITSSAPTDLTSSTNGVACDVTPQVSVVSPDRGSSPLYLPTTSCTNLAQASAVEDDGSVNLTEFGTESNSKHGGDNCRSGRMFKLRPLTKTQSSSAEAPLPRYTKHSGPQDSNDSDDFQHSDDNNKRNDINDNNSNEGNNNGQHQTSNNDSHDQKNDDNSNNGEENNNPNENQKAVSQTPNQTSQALVQKLQDIYRNIVKQEVELQERCSHLTFSQTTDLKNLWVIYKVNAELINNYVAFITTALLPSQPDADLLIGQEIVSIYRIERRLWVHGTITFLDVLKNFSNFMDPEVCCQFITHVFISISNMLSDMPHKFTTPWLERLGDLSRMAIALYPSGFIDWKLSAEHWYKQALNHTCGHGKLYYHMSTVQQNTLEAFVNLGKSVFCRDTFIPSQQYMQLVIDNIYQRAFAERNSGNHRNSLMVEYLKHSEVMLLSSFLESPELQKVVLTFFQHKFGLSLGTNDFFSHQDIFLQEGERVKYFFRHAPLFAESHILQLVGFGDPKNPFALLFELPKFLKERKERKERRKSKSNSSEKLLNASADDFLENVDSPRFLYEFPEDIAIWKQSLANINVTSMKCSAILLKNFLHGPLVVGAPHLLPWAYFLLATSIRIEKLPNETLKSFWITLMRQLFPWNSIINFLNMLIAVVLDNVYKTSPIDTLCEQFDSVDVFTLVNHFSKNEDLPEVWKCWGTLWFDVISMKSQMNCENSEYNGIKDISFLDSPIDGISFDEEDEIGLKFWKRACRLIFLFKGMAQNFSWGLKLSHIPVQSKRPLAAGHPLQNFSFKFEEGPILIDDQMYIHSTISRFEEISARNLDINAQPGLSMLEGITIFDLPGYRQIHPDYTCFNKNGALITCSLFTSGNLEKGPIQGGDDFNTERYPRAQSLPKPEETPTSELDRLEREWLDTCMNPYFIEQSHEAKFPAGDLACYCDSGVSYFVLDATSWLRHFAHVYKLATNGVLRFAICLTTFQELRFLRKSKDETVVEAATRAVITARQLYSEKRLLPLRFTGNVATHLEEHLEFEEQITWRSHVDEFVIEAVFKAQKKFETLNSQAEEAGQDYIVSTEQDPFRFVALVSDDTNMRLKAHTQNIRTVSSRFMLAVCNQIGLTHHACTN
ncbi:LADA_0E03950g1_1 [Lachancea dasiensis]|uniref:LADA_0E03950g1_1 n=1 Tax=Lachancea dasiensis TaxID=1072105 RepID=A0A1G4JBH3_9SACH|nr:LADA_0E03950g1_1 [Lachancea dasiensis]